MTDQKDFSQAYDIDGSEAGKLNVRVDVKNADEIGSPSLDDNLEVPEGDPDADAAMTVAGVDSSGNKYRMKVDANGYLQIELVAPVTPPSKYIASTNGGYDGVVSYATASTLTVTGTPFTIKNEDIVYVKAVNSTSNASRILVNGVNGIHFEISAGTITKVGGNDFSANEDFELGYNGQDKSYNSLTDSKRCQEVDPLSQHYIPDEYELTAVADGATDNSTEISMDGYRGVSIEVLKTGAASSFTWTVESTNRDISSAVAADWMNTCQFGFSSATVASAASYTANGEIYSNPGFTPRGHRVSVSPSGGTADFEILVKRWY